MSDSTSEDYRRIVQICIEQSIRVKQDLQTQSAAIAQVADVLVRVYRDGKKALLFGNGGSASDAQHIAAELVGRYYIDRRALPAEALTVNTSSLTAIANDYSFDQVFSRQIEAFGNSGDVAIGISTSGNSRNVVEGVQAAKRKEMVTIGLTGESGGHLKAITDYCICVPSKDTPRIQEAHIMIGHIWSELLERALFPQGQKKT